MGYETSPGHQGASLLFLRLIFACSLSSQTGLFHQSSSSYCLCHCSLFHSLPPSLHLSLHLFFPLLPAPRPQTAWLNTQANVSLFKETQVVDILAMGQDQNEELL